jgi:hypothetical protein
MSEITVRAIESFAWEGGSVHDGSEWSADAEVVARFPQFFTAPPEPEPAVPPAKRAPARARKAVTGG